MTTSGDQSGVFLPIGADPRRDGAAALATAGSGVHHMAQGFGKIWFTDGWPDDAIGAVTLNVPRPSGRPGAGRGSPTCVVPRLTGLTLR